MECNSIVRSMVLIVTLTSMVESLPIDFEASAVSYLAQYGFLGNQDPRTGALRTEDSVKSAIRDFQIFGGLNATGTLDEPTVTLMQTPRCGVVDKVGPGMLARRRKRYTIQGSSWPRKRLTYRITQYSSKLTRAEVDEAVLRAFKVWSDVSRLEFVRTSGNADIVIKFVSRSHGDGNAFDGSGKVLAHAFFPQFGGDAHFDEEESWTVKTRRGVNLFQVAAHEFGHSLGLSHSQERSALMAPFYRGYQNPFELDSDDVAGIQAIYGRPLRSQPTTTAAPSGGRTTTQSGVRTTTRSSRPRPAPTDLCRDSKIDAVTRTKSGTTYVFKGSNYYRLNSAGVDAGYPRPIGQNREWEGVTGPVDAALTTISGNTYIFKGRQYWKFINMAAQPGYPKFISQGFPGVPSDLDAAFIWSGNGQPYFIKGNQYWRYTFSQYRVSPGYPKPLAAWRNLPSTVDSVFQWENDRTYFFKDGNYYRFNDRDFRVDPGYPRRNTEWWFGCSGPKDSQPINNNPPTIHEKQNNNNQYSGPVVPDSDLKDDTPSIWASTNLEQGSTAPQTAALSLVTYILTATILLLLL